MAITTKYDAEVNLTVAREALNKGIKEGLSPDKIKKLKKHVKDAESILAQIKKTFKDSEKK